MWPLPQRSVDVVGRSSAAVRDEKIDEARKEVLERLMVLVARIEDVANVAAGQQFGDEPAELRVVRVDVVDSVRHLVTERLQAGNRGVQTLEELGDLWSKFGNAIHSVFCLPSSFTQLPCSKCVEIEVECDYIGVDHPLALRSGAVDSAARKCAQHICSPLHSRPAFLDHGSSCAPRQMATVVVVGRTSRHLADPVPASGGTRGPAHVEGARTVIAPWVASIVEDCSSRSVGSIVMKAFVSHSTTDQERFVRGLATRLQTDGVDTWYAEWGLLDGDSLVQRIFAEGIGEADVFIVVLSANSVNSHWVQAELDVGVVRSIDKQCRLITIVIDDVLIPVALQATKYRRISDVSSYDDDFDGLLRSIFNQSTQPPLGEPPPYTRAPKIRGLTPVDAVVFVALVELAIENGSNMVQGNDLHVRCAPQDLTDAAVHESILALEAKGYIKDGRARGDRVQFVIVRLRTIREFVERTRDLRVIERHLIAGLVNERGPSRIDLGPIAERAGVERIVAEAILDRLEPRYLKLQRTSSNRLFVTNVSPLLARELD